eukprot:1330048-Rhodomonas_salina.2
MPLHSKDGFLRLTLRCFHRNITATVSFARAEQSIRGAGSLAASVCACEWWGIPWLPQSDNAAVHGLALFSKASVGIDP